MPRWRQQGLLAFISTSPHQVISDMAEYQQLWDQNGGISTTVLRLLDQAFIPDDPANRDRAAYNQWVEDGNVPDPPDPPPEPPPPEPDANLRLDAGVEA